MLAQPRQLHRQTKTLLISTDMLELIKYLHPQQKLVLCVGVSDTQRFILELHPSLRELYCSLRAN